MPRLSYSKAPWISTRSFRTNRVPPQTIKTEHPGRANVPTGVFLNPVIDRFPWGRAPTGKSAPPPTIIFQLPTAVPNRSHPVSSRACIPIPCLYRTQKAGDKITMISSPASLILRFLVRNAGSPTAVGLPPPATSAPRHKTAGEPIEITKAQSRPNRPPAGNRSTPRYRANARASSRNASPVTESREAIGSPESPPSAIACTSGTDPRNGTPCSAASAATRPSGPAGPKM